MIITKKKLNEMLAEKEKEVCDRFYRENERRDTERWNAQRFEELEKRMWKLEDELRELKGIKDKYDAVCELVNKRA